MLKNGSIASLGKTEVLHEPQVNKEVEKYIKIAALRHFHALMPLETPHRIFPVALVLSLLISVVFLGCNNPFLEIRPVKSILPEPQITPSPTYYTVMFDAGGGTPIPGNQLVTSGSKVARVQAMTKQDSGFIGWYLDKAFTKPWDFATDTVTADITLYARWSVPSHSVTFVANGGAPEPISQVINEGSHVVEPMGMVKDGWGFGGWFTDSSCTDEWNFYTNLLGTSDLTLYAKWSVPYSIVNFETNGGTAMPSLNILVGAKIPEPLGATKEGFGFGGWFTDEACTKVWNFAQDTISSDDSITLYARWESSFYRVAFNTDGGSPALPTLNIGYGNRIPAPQAMTKPNSAFIGWYSNEDRTIPWNFNTNVVRSNMTLYALWSKPSHTVTFYTNGGNPVPVQQVIYEGSHIAEPSGMGREGWGFGGWFTDNNTFANPWDFYTDVIGTSDLLLYAKWTTTYCVVNFESNGGTPVRTLNIDTGAKIPEPINISKDSHGFGGWYIDSDFTKPWDFATDTVSANTPSMTLYAKWVIDIYTVEYMANGGNPAPGNQEIPFGQKIPVPPIMSQAGLGFQGWYKDSNFSELWDFSVDVVRGNTTLFAKWETAHYIFSFNTDGGYPVPPNQDITYNGKAQEPPRIPSMIRSGYEFDGWYTSTSWDAKYDFATVVTSNVQVYARWVPAIENMVWVPGGSFLMGDANTTGSKPVHGVTVTGYYIGIYQVTQQKYMNAIGRNPSNFQAGQYDRPVDQVTWYDAVFFCNELSQSEGLDPVYAISDYEYSTAGTYIVNATVTADFSKNGYRLPTEAEWEYAARGGNDSPDSFTYVGSNIPSDVAWYTGNSSSQTHPVGQLAPNMLGIYDMSGNLAEWCWDWYDGGYYAVSPNTDPTGPVAGTEKVRRGGSWNNGAAAVGTYARNSFGPASNTIRSYWVMGFRLVRRLGE